MFIKIGTGIFNSNDIEAIVFDGDEISVYLKHGKDEEEKVYEVGKNGVNVEILEKIVAALNTESKENV